MKSEEIIKDIPENFKEEHKELVNEGINSWELINSLEEEKLYRIARQGRSTISNLKRLQGIASLVCDLKLSPANASLLLHSGISSVKALAEANPQEILRQTGRLERSLRTSRRPVVTLEKANQWIKKARIRQMKN